MNLLTILHFNFNCSLDYLFSALPHLLLKLFPFLLSLLHHLLLYIDICTFIMMPYLYFFLFFYYILFFVNLVIRLIIVLEKCWIKTKQISTTHYRLFTFTEYLFNVILSSFFSFFLFSFFSFFFPFHETFECHFF